MSILDSVLSVISGGATGLIGTAVQSFYTYKTRELDIDLEKQKGANELEQRRLDIQAQAQELSSQAQIAQINADATVSSADDEALKASYSTEPQQYSEKSLLTHSQEWVMVLLDALRAVIRPSMTIYLCILTSLIYFQTRSLINTDKIDSFALLQKLVDTILYLTTTVCLWWFGSRAQKQSTK